MEVKSGSFVYFGRQGDGRYCFNQSEYNGLLCGDGLSESLMEMFIAHYCSDKVGDFSIFTESFVINNREIFEINLNKISFIIRNIDNVWNLIINEKHINRIGYVYFNELQMLTSDSINKYIRNMLKTNNITMIHIRNINNVSNTGYIIYKIVKPLNIVLSLYICTYIFPSHRAAWN